MIQIDIDHQYHRQLKNMLVVDHLFQVDMLYQFEYIVLFDTIKKTKGSNKNLKNYFIYWYCILFSFSF